jgi:hypothetical protein
MTSNVPNTTSMKYPRIGYHRPAIATTITRIPRYGVILSIIFTRIIFEIFQ